MTPTERRLEGAFKRRQEELWFSPSQRRRYDFDVTDPNIRRAILKVSPAVVSMVSFAGKDIFLVASGTIIKCEDLNGTYSSSILTCASLLRSSTDTNTMGDNIKVCLVDGKSFKGCISAHDHHYNIAIIKITSDVALPTVSLATLDDSISTDLSESPSLRRPSSSVKLCPGDSVVALGRFGSDTTELMAALGKFSHECCKFDCRELFRANCEIRKAGVGGPLINCHGEVIGLNFYDSYCTPFLPINIVLKCLKRFERNRKPRRPWLGMDLTYLCVSSIGKLEKIKSKFNISSGVLVQEVVKGSPADFAGILKGDVIVQFGDKSVRGVLEFYNAMWKKVGKSAKVVVIRESSSTHLKLKVFVEETDTDKVNRWNAGYPWQKKKKWKFGMCVGSVAAFVVVSVSSLIIGLYVVRCLLYELKGHEGMWWLCVVERLTHER